VTYRVVPLIVTTIVACGLSLSLGAQPAPTSAVPGRGVAVSSCPVASPADDVRPSGAQRTLDGGTSVRIRARHALAVARVTSLEAATSARLLVTLQVGSQF
jgi:hypothetical protein